MLQIISSEASLIHSAKREGPKVESWGTTALTGDSYEDFPFKRTFSCLVLRCGEVRLNTLPEIS